MLELIDFVQKIREYEMLREPARYVDGTVLMSLRTFSKVRDMVLDQKHLTHV